MEMVSETKQNGSDAPTEVLPALAEKPAGLPPGNYTLVGWDMDTTGRRLIDEICQLAAYTPKQTYSQYIMPYGDLNPGARRRHNVRVVTVGRYRMLKDTVTHKILKTKSEISALSDFLEWLEKEKGDGSIILIYHEPRRLSPTMLLEALSRHNFLDRFKKIVAGFADSYALAAEKCKSTVKSVSLRVLARVLLDADTLSVDSALDRATAAYRIVEHLSQSEQQEVGGAGEGSTASKDMVETACAWARPVHTELEVLDNLKKLLERQNTFRPIFAPLLHLARPERRRVTHLRRMLADAGLLYEHLQQAWEEQRLTGLEKQLAALSTKAKEEDMKELIEILDCHFDPAKEPKGLKPRINNKNRAVGEGEEGAGDGEGSSSNSQTPEHNSPAKTNNVTSNDEGQEVAAN
ncbi:maternal protein exuperantia [Leptidea sinapis]|uniref:maternal protein exuperantia n=1 Tax=Leptidea sinapis TaxID=189913 RepID=UPI00212AB4EA|nr:maternal protein exuperantia [Leptidea sinapis]XP_050680544.1 maternal protein exuperantia [Leptidea sinapis]